MSPQVHEPLVLDDEQYAILCDLLESERTKLLVAIRHSDHRAFRDELRRRLTSVETLIERLRPR